MTTSAQRYVQEQLKKRFGLTKDTARRLADRLIHNAPDQRNTVTRRPDAAQSRARKP